MQDRYKARLLFTHLPYDCSKIIIWEEILFKLKIFTSRKNNKIILEIRNKQLKVKLETLANSAMDIIKIKTKMQSIDRKIY